MSAEENKASGKEAVLNEAEEDNGDQKAPEVDKLEEKIKEAYEIFIVDQKKGVLGRQYLIPRVHFWLKPNIPFVFLLVNGSLASWTPFGLIHLAAPLSLFFP